MCLSQIDGSMIGDNVYLTLLTSILSRSSIGLAAISAIGILLTMNRGIPSFIYFL